MLRYETLMLAVPEITADEAKSVERELEETVQEKKGRVLSFDRWGKYKLAYPIRNHEYGVYFLMRFEANKEKVQDLINDLETIFKVKKSDLIMRDILVQISSEGSLEYKRPESLEETPSKDVDTFLKENKMTGLMHKSSEKSEKKSEVQAEPGRKSMPQQELENIEAEEAQIQEANEADIKQDEPDLP